MIPYYVISCTEPRSVRRQLLRHCDKRLAAV